jgi:pyruvate formate lyase activating enzyme
MMKSPKEGSGTVFNIQRYSIEDGPGIRTTVFLKGCPLRCLWCSNPESQSSNPELAHQDSLCVGCSDCVRVCAEGAISIVSNDGKYKVKIDREKCNECGKCVDECTAGALKFYGQKMTVDEVFNEVIKDKGYYARSGGGVTIGGGEPLMQADFVAALLHRLHRTGIHTAIDTCGYSSISALEKVLPEVDLFLFDMKLMNRQQHKRFTGRYNNMILRNARLIIEKGVPMIIRVPLIPGISDSEENLDEIARFVSELDNKLHVDLLPYHRFGMGKYEMLDMDYQLKNTEYLNEEQLQKAMKVFERYGLDCEIQ